MIPWSVYVLYSIDLQKVSNPFKYTGKRCIVYQGSTNLHVGAPWPLCPILNGAALNDALITVQTNTLLSIIPEHKRVTFTYCNSVPVCRPTSNPLKMHAHFYSYKKEEEKGNVNDDKVTMKSTLRWKEELPIYKGLFLLFFVFTVCFPSHIWLIESW